MARFRKHRYEPEYLERKLNLSASATGVVAAQVSSGSVPEAPATVATVAPVPSDPTVTVQEIQNTTRVGTTSIHHASQRLTGQLLSTDGSGSAVSAADDPPPGDPPPDPLPPPPPGPGGGPASGSSGSGSGSSSAASSGSQSGSGASHDAMAHGSGASGQGGGIYVSGGALVINSSN